MAQVVFSEDAREDLERLYEFLTQKNPYWGAEAVEVIRDGLNILIAHPLVGRRLESSFRELVISRGSSGYLALYFYDESKDVVVVHGIRHQREAGYT